MADASSAEDASVTFHVKSAGGAKYTLTLPLSTTTTDLKEKLATAEYANVPAAAQRLIYSGKVLKDNDTLATYNVKEGNTMHLVKSAASNLRNNPAAQQSGISAQSGTPPAAAGVPQNLASGTGNDPLAGLTGARYAGFAGLPNASMFQNPPSQEDMIRQLEDPHFATMMREAINNPQFVDMMLNSNPTLRNIPGAREMLQSDHFRRTLTDPQQLRSIMQMQQMMGGMGGMGGFGGGAGQGAFPAPGATNTTDGADATQNTQGQNQQPPVNPFAQLANNPMFGFPPTQQGATGTDNTNQANQQANPFAALFNPAMLGGQQQQGGNAGTNDSPAPNPMQNLQNLQNLMNMMGAGNAGNAAGGGDGAQQQQPNFAEMFNQFGGGGFGGPPDNRPPEERFSTQLRQLNEMGFHNFDRNIQALTRSGGDVNGALEWLFSQPA
jgi:ubiquilin